MFSRLLPRRMGLAWSASKEVFGHTSHYESYAFKILEDHATWSLREYAPAVAAEITSGANDNRGFGRLARYIGVFGTPENQVRDAVAMTTPVVNEAIAMTTPVVNEAIAMTTPVLNEQQSNGGGVMRFVLPSKYQQVDDAPVPTDSGIRIVQVPAKLCAVVQFSGNWEGMTSSVAQEQKDILVQALTAHGGLVPCEGGGWQLHRFNPPYTLPWFRTNEVVMPVSRL